MERTLAQELYLVAKGRTIQLEMLRDHESLVSTVSTVAPISRSRFSISTINFRSASLAAVESEHVSSITSQDRGAPPWEGAAETIAAYWAGPRYRMWPRM